MRDLESRKEKIKKKVIDTAENNNLGRYEVIANVVRRWMHQGPVETGNPRQLNYLRGR